MNGWLPRILNLYESVFSTIFWHLLRQNLFHVEFFPSSFSSFSSFFHPLFFFFSSTILLFSSFSVFIFHPFLFSSIILFSLDRAFEKVSLYCEAFTNMVPLTFVLGFYVSIVVARWWEQFMQIPWPDKYVYFSSFSHKNYFFLTRTISFSYTRTISFSYTRTISFSISRFALSLSFLFVSFSRSIRRMCWPIQSSRNIRTRFDRVQVLPTGTICSACKTFSCILTIALLFIKFESNVEPTFKHFSTSWFYFDTFDTNSFDTFDTRSFDPFDNKQFWYIW